MPPKAQPGEGIVVVVDVGPKTRLGLPINQTFYHQSKTCLINILQRKIFAEKCRDRVAVVLFGTDGTDNPSAANGEYQHITVFQDLQLVDWGYIGKAEQLPRGSHDGDWLDAIVVAMELLHDQNAPEFSSKKIVLLTDFSGEFSDSQFDSILSGLKSVQIDLSVIGPEVGDDDDSPGDDEGPSTSNGTSSNRGGMSWSGKPKSTVQLAGEALASSLVTAIDGIMCSFDEAIPQLIFFQKKSQSSANWNSMLEIGPDFRIPVTGRIKIKRATLSSWRRCHTTDENAVILKEKSYHKQDDENTEVEEDDVISGYRYGTTLVPFTNEDQQMSYSSNTTSSQLTVLGFTRSDHCPLPLRAGDQVLIVTTKDGDEDGAVALSAIIRALEEMDMVGICRRVYRKGSNPVMGALYPYIAPDYECLVWVALPFSEDVRALSFPSLKKFEDSVTADQNAAMDSLIDAMSLNVSDGGDGESEELLEPSTVLNPHLQHFFNCMTDRALNPNRPLPPPQQHVLDILSVPEELQESLNNIAEKLARLFPTTKVVRRTKRQRENIFDNEDQSEAKRSKQDSDAEDLDNFEFEVGGNVTQVTTATPLQDFNALIHAQPMNFLTYCDQLIEVLLQLSETLSPGDSPADIAITNKIIGCLVACRKECVEISPSHYNKLMQKLKEILSGRSLLSAALWCEITRLNLGLVTSADSPQSTVSVEEAEKFLRAEEENTEEERAPPPPQQDNEDYDDLLDDL